MPNILSCPPEIAAQICMHCDGLPEVRALTSTCKQLHFVWKATAPAIIWAVAPRTILAFDDALMAVRATNLVKPAFENGQVPPDVGPIAELTGEFRKPTLSELLQILSMQHLARCLQHMYFNSSVDNGESPWTTLVEPRTPRWQVAGTDKAAAAQTMARWEERFRRATYRLFLAGAILAHAYHEPLFRLTKGLHQRPDSTVYRHEPDDEKDSATFDALSSWIVKASKKEAARREFLAYWRRPYWLAQVEEDEEEFDHDGNSDSMTDPDIYAVWELMSMVSAYELTRIRFAKVSRSISPGSLENSAWTKWLPAQPPDRVRKASVVMFGDFQLHEVSMPTEVEDTTDILLVAHRITPPDEPVKTAEKNGHTGRPADETPRPFSWDVYRILESTPLPPDRSERFPGPALELKFFTHSLSKRWNLKFTDEDKEWGCSPYREFLADAEVFVEGHDWEESYGFYFLVSC